MPRTRSSIEKIRAELTWVHQPLDPTNAVAAICDAAKTPIIPLASVCDPSKRSLDVASGILVFILPRLPVGRPEDV